MLIDQLDHGCSLQPNEQMAGMNEQMAGMNDHKADMCQMAGAYMHVVDVLDNEQRRQAKDEASRHPAQDHKVQRLKPRHPGASPQTDVDERKHMDARPVWACMQQGHRQDSEATSK